MTSAVDDDVARSHERGILYPKPARAGAGVVRIVVVLT